MTARRLLLVHNGPDSRDLGLSLRGTDHVFAAVEGFAHRGDDEAEAERLLAEAGPFDCLALAPIDAASPGRLGLGDVSTVLTCAFALIKAALAIQATADQGRIVVLLPAEIAMGDPGLTIGSALAGAMLSLSRTVALEVRKDGGTINTIMYPPPDPAISGAARFAAVAMQIVALADPASRGVNGQEIFAAAGTDVGRLHP